MPSLADLQERLLFDDKQLQKVVGALLPLVLSYIFESNIVPQLNFSQEELGLLDGDLRNCVVSFPTLSGYSLEKRYRPRLEACCTAGMDDMRVLSLITLTDISFCKSIGASHYCCATE